MTRVMTLVILTFIRARHFDEADDDDAGEDEDDDDDDMMTCSCRCGHSQSDPPKSV